eukprot:gene51748-20909_t
MRHGNVRVWNHEKGYGFITGDDGSDVFARGEGFHAANVAPTGAGVKHPRARRVRYALPVPPQSPPASGARPKVCDFGLARAAGGDAGEHAMLLMSAYSGAIDIWSTGCLTLVTDLIGVPAKDDFAFASSGQAPGCAGCEEARDFMKNMKEKQCDGKLRERLDGGWEAMRMLVFNPAKRIRAAEAMGHAYFDDVRD